MQTAALHYKLIKKIKDDRFDEDKLHQYELLLNIGAKDLQVGVIDADSRVLLLEDYVFPSLSSHQDLLQAVEQLYDAHPVLKAAFWKRIKVCIKNNKFVQVPAALFVDSATTDYLGYNARLDDKAEEILSIRQGRVDAVTVFAVQKDLKAWFLTTYPNNTPVFLHQSAALIEGIMDASQRFNDDPLFVYIDRFKFQILACQKGKLLYYNQFQNKHFSDYVRYIMLVMKTLNRDQGTGRITMWGYIGKNSPHYHEFYKYINNVGFGPRPGYLKFGFMFDEIQDHYFLDLYSIHLLGNG